MEKYLLYTGTTDIQSEESKTAAASTALAGDLVSRFDSLESLDGVVVGWGHQTGLKRESNSLDEHHYPLL